MNTQDAWAVADLEARPIIQRAREAVAFTSRALASAAAKREAMRKA